MDEELLIALCVLWLSTTMALLTCLSMWFLNNAESFHPHCVDVDHRHSMFVVVHSDTSCKLDCCVKSISAFVAPRGSSSSKQFTVYCVMISIAGFLGTFRWLKVGDGALLEVILALSGYASLLLVAAFELNVSPEMFLEDKLLVTGWLLQKLRLEKSLPFNVNDIKSKDFIDFVRHSSEICHLYEELDYISSRGVNYNSWGYDVLWTSMHMTGAIAYVVFVTAAILINEMEEAKVAWITGACFLLFCVLGYLTGHYLPVIRPLRCYILLWNPFLREPRFMLRLQQAVHAYHSRYLHLDTASPAESSDPLSKAINRKQRKKNKSKLMHSLSSRGTRSSHLDEEIAARKADKYLNTPMLKFARRYPATYLRVIGHVLVMSELIAMLTPSIAMGIQWVTALCDGPPVPALLELFWIGVDCLVWGDCKYSLRERWTHCILK